MELVAGRRPYGTVTGEVFLTGQGSKVRADDLIAFVPRVSIIASIGIYNI